MLPAKVCQFLLTGKFSGSPKGSKGVSFIASGGPKGLISASCSQGCCFRCPAQALGKRARLGRYAATLFASGGRRSARGDRARCSLSRAGEALVTQGVDRLRKRLYFVVRETGGRGKRCALVSSPRGDFSGTLGGVDTVGLAVRNDDRYYCLDRAKLVFGDPVSCRYLMRLRGKSCSFGEFSTSRFMSLFDPVVRGASCRGCRKTTCYRNPLLFPTPLSRAVHMAVSVSCAKALGGGAFALRGVPLRHGGVCLFAL